MIRILTDFTGLSKMVMLWLSTSGAMVASWWRHGGIGIMYYMNLSPKYRNAFYAVQHS